jgi:hypothetical protein
VDGGDERQQARPDARHDQQQRRRDPQAALKRRRGCDHQQRENDHDQKPHSTPSVTRLPSSKVLAVEVAAKEAPALPF